MQIKVPTATTHEPATKKELRPWPLGLVVVPAVVVVFSVMVVDGLVVVPAVVVVLSVMIGVGLSVVLMVRLGFCEVVLDDGGLYVDVVVLSVNALLVIWPFICCDSLVLALEMVVE